MASLVTNAGLANVIAAWNAYASRPIWLQFGTGSGQGGGATDLASPVGSRAIGSTSQQTTTLAGDTLKIEGTVTATAPNTITEVGVFDAGMAGNLDVYGDFTGIALALGDAIVFRVNVTAAAA